MREFAPELEPEWAENLPEDTGLMRGQLTHAVPGLGNARVLRSWTGFEANVPDFYPLAGALPWHDDAFVLGCVRGDRFRAIAPVAGGGPVEGCVGQVAAWIVHGIDDGSRGSRVTTVRRICTARTSKHTDPTTSRRWRVM